MSPVYGHFTREKLNGSRGRGERGQRTYNGGVGFFFGKFGILQFGIDNLKSFNIIHMFINPNRVNLIES